MSSDRVDSGAVAAGDSAATEEETGSGPNWSPVNWLVIVLFTILTVVGMALSVGWIEAVVAVPTGRADAGAVIVPLYVYLYAGLGALGYVFTKLMVELDRYDEWNELEQLMAMAMRIPAGWILATGVYLFIGNFGQVDGSTGARFAAGAAFLVGLYVNVALKALGSLADRVLGRAARSSD
jgi:hypothetical protein